MRKNNRKTLPNFSIPNVLQSEQTLRNLEQIAQTGNLRLIKEKTYKGERTVNGKKVQEVREKLCEIYHQKCAYCEDIEASPDVEHYRPKKRVTEESAHPGYYWLCYEWTNLLPSCRFCNTGSGKVNQFPIMGNRALLPEFQNGNLDKIKCKANLSPLIDELPYLLNPEIDSPDNGSYFKFSINGKMEGIDAENRGKKTIEICDLNRQTLLLRRQKVQDRIINMIKDLLAAYILDLPEPGDRFFIFLDKIFERFYDWTRPDEPFSLFVSYLYENFEELVTSQLDTPEQGAIINDAFIKFNSMPST